MQDKLIWEGRSSPLLFVYEYIAAIAFAGFAMMFLDGHFYVLSVLAVGYFYFKARSMRYTISASEAYFSPAIGDNEAITVKLTDIVEIQIVDRPPWSLFHLGTLILITDPDSEYQPCMKCIDDPHALARRIRRAVQAAGGADFPVEVI